jgi:hypothetical protein
MAEDINRLVPELPRLLDVQQFVGAREPEVCIQQMQLPDSLAKPFLTPPYGRFVMVRS